MDAFVVFKNGLHQLAASLSPNALVSFDLYWMANDDKEFTIDVSKLDNVGTHRWRPIQLTIGENIAFVTKETFTVDEPTETLKPEELERLQQSMKATMKPKRKRKPSFRNFGELHCRINDKDVFSFRLNTNNAVSINFVWDGDRRGRSMIYVGSVGSSETKLKPPRIKFGDLVAFHSVEVLEKK